jgi:hypothetical protein
MLSLDNRQPTFGKLAIRRQRVALRRIGEAAMSYYRLYFMKPGSGKILRFAEFEAPDDEAAEALAQEHEGAEALELWSRKRKVIRFEPFSQHGDPALRAAE